MSLCKFWIALMFASIAVMGVGQSDVPRKSYLDAASTNFSVGVGYNFSVGDLSDRFGNIFSVHGLVEHQTGSDWIFGGQYSLYFGNDVKEDVLSHIRLDNGQLLGANQSYASSFLRMRGGYLGAYVGRFIPMSSKYKSGVKVTVSGGIFQHYVRILDDERNLTQVQGEYLKGYDRLSRGLGVQEFIGWQYLSEDKRINFYVGLEFTQGFTKAVRGYDFDQGGLSSSDSRLDGLVGVKLGWIVPIFSDYEEREIFY